MFDFFDFTKKENKKSDVVDVENTKTFKRFKKNPIIKPNSHIPWKAKAVFNPAAIFLDGSVHIIYRGQSFDNISSLGYCRSSDGFTIDEDLSDPIYSPSAPFEVSTKPGWNSGCEDPRITRIDDRLFMTYVAYDGTSPPRVALTSIDINNFLNKNFNWDKPKLISPPGVDDKDACIVKDENFGLIALHRLGNSMWVDKLYDLAFPEVKFLTGGILATPRSSSWDNIKIGLAAPPITTDKGLLILYHAACDPDFSYKVGAMLLDFGDIHNVIARSDQPLLSPEMDYEINGHVPKMIFPCGAVIIDNTIFMYYGSAESYVCLATMPVNDLLNTLVKK